MIEWSTDTYSWSKRGEQKRIEQTKKKGKRLNICGLLEIGKGFEYGLALKSFKSDSYIKLMDWQAEKAEKKRLAEIEKTQITLDELFQIGIDSIKEIKDIIGLE